MPPPQWGPWVGTTRAREATQEAPVRTPAEPALTRPRVSAFVGPLIPKAGQIPVDHTGYAARPTCPSQRLLSQQPPIPKPHKGVPRSLQKPLPRGAVGDRPGLGGAQQGGTSPRAQADSRTDRALGTQARAQVRSSRGPPHPAPGRSKPESQHRPALQKLGAAPGAGAAGQTASHKLPKQPHAGAARSPGPPVARRPPAPGAKLRPLVRKAGPVRPGHHQQESRARTRACPCGGREHWPSQGHRR